MNKNIFKSIWAVVAGFLVVVVLSVVTDAILEKAGVLPSGGYLSNSLSLLALVYRTIYTIAGGYLAASLAPNRPARHVMILGLVGILGGLAGLISTWGKGMGPVWYPVALAVLAYPSVWLGGRWKVSKSLDVVNF